MVEANADALVQVNHEDDKPMMKVPIMDSKNVHSRAYHKTLSFELKQGRTKDVAKVAARAAAKIAVEHYKSQLAAPME